MMQLKRRLLLLRAAVVLLLVGTSVWAQDADLSQQVSLPDSYTISIPEGWAVEEDTELNASVFQGDDVVLTIQVPSQIDDSLGLDADTALSEVLLRLFGFLENQTARKSDIKDFEQGLFPGVSYRFSGDQGSGLFVVLEFAEQEYGVFDFVTLSEDVTARLDLAEAIAATFLPADVALDAAPASEVASEPCFVSTSSEDTVQLRVGPGFNRAVVTFLPANIDFAVTGSFTADDDSEWFQLDKAEAAPTSAASEVWVAREDVDEQGACDAVADASAPPIVPIISNPPVQPTSVPGVPPASTTTTTGGQAPSNGTWTLTFAPTSPISCLNTDTMHINTSELWDTTPFVERITVARDGNSFTYGGDSFTRLTPNSFSGSFTFEDGSNLQIRFDVISSTQMVGQAVINVTADNGTPCSGTTTIYVNHN